MGGVGPPGLCRATSDGLLMVELHVVLIDVLTRCMLLLSQTGACQRAAAEYHALRSRLHRGGAVSLLGTRRPQ